MVRRAMDAAGGEHARAPREPLVVSLTEAMTLVARTVPGHRLTLSALPGSDVLVWCVESFPDRFDHMSEEWEHTLSRYLGRPVVTRDDAAELRAALEGVVRGAEVEWDTEDAINVTLDLEAWSRARAALAATEGSE